jgi:CheY-like chemotaxis protein/anti-sigma regulatory factor (Ser/Thr protein kinase)
MRIIEDVLDVGRITSGKLRLEITTASVVDAVDGAVQVVRPAAEAKRLTLDVDVPSDVGTIPADPERLQQVVWNLLSNSIKFTPAGGRIRVAAARTESSVLLRVQDDGQGIRPEFLPHLFEPFRQGDGSTTRRHGGLGLGLAIVRQLVQAHGGQITVHSDGEGKGALFTVDLPARPAPRESDKMPTRPPSAAGSPRASRRVRLDGVRALIVDDDDDSREFLELMLADQGAIVMSASSAGEALARIARDRPDVLVSDIGMPDVSGYALIRRVRSLPESDGGRTPAIALTAYARAVDGERAFSAGFQAHVAKPVDAERLTAVVANLAGLSARASRDSHSLTGGSSRPGR